MQTLTSISIVHYFKFSSLYFSDRLFVTEEGSSWCMSQGQKGPELEPTPATHLLPARKPTLPSSTPASSLDLLLPIWWSWMSRSEIIPSRRNRNKILHLHERRNKLRCHNFEFLIILQGRLYEYLLYCKTYNFHNFSTVVVRNVLYFCISSITLHRFRHLSGPKLKTIAFYVFFILPVRFEPCSVLWKVNALLQQLC